MACTLDLYTDYLLSSTGQTSAMGLSRLFDGQISHDQVTRWLTGMYLDSRQVWAHAKPLIRRTERELAADDFAVLVVDDSILEKAHTDANALLCTHYDHRLGRYVKGLNFVSLLYVAGPVSVPIAVELVEKTQAVTSPKTQKLRYKSPLTKNQMVQAQLRVAQQQVHYRYLLADSWYASAEHMALVRELGHEFIFALPTSRTMALSEGRPASRACFTRLIPCILPMGSPCVSGCVAARKRCSWSGKSSQTRTGRKGCCTWGVATRN